MQCFELRKLHATTQQLITFLNPTSRLENANKHRPCQCLHRVRLFVDDHLSHGSVVCFSRLSISCTENRTIRSLCETNHRKRQWCVAGCQRLFSIWSPLLKPRCDGSRCVLRTEIINVCVLLHFLFLMLVESAAERASNSAVCSGLSNTQQSEGLCSVFFCQRLLARTRSHHTTCTTSRTSTRTSSYPKPFHVRSIATNDIMEHNR